MTTATLQCYRVQDGFRCLNPALPGGPTCAMHTATAVPGAVSIRRLGDLGGVHFLYVDIDREDPYQSFRRLPDAVTYAGRTYGKSAYDSDAGFAIYRTDRPVALAVRRGK